MHRSTSGRLKALLWTVVLCSIAAMASAGTVRGQDEREARSFVDGLGSKVYKFAWPTAIYGKTEVRSLQPASAGYDVTVRLSGTSAVGGGLWMDLVFELRDGRLADIRVLRHNAIISPPFATARAVGRFLEGMAESYAAQPAPARPSTSPVPASSSASDRPYTLRIANDCHVPIRVWLGYRDTNGVWQTNGSWQIPGLTNEVLLVDTLPGDRRLLVRDRVVYSYATPVVDSTGYEWSGGHNVSFGGATLPMRADTLAVDASSSLTLVRGCTNVHRLGVVPINADRFEVDGVAYGYGARISKIEPGHSAQRAGLQEGDVIYAINGEPVTDAWRLQRLLIRFSGQAIKISFARNGRAYAVELAPTPG